MVNRICKTDKGAGEGGGSGAKPGRRNNKHSYRNETRENVTSLGEKSYFSYV